MKTTSKNTKIVFDKNDFIKANKKAAREIELEDSTGWYAIHKTHKTAKSYTRKFKHKKFIISE